MKLPACKGKKMTWNKIDADVTGWRQPSRPRDESCAKEKRTLSKEMRPEEREQESEDPWEGGSTLRSTCVATQHEFAHPKEITLKIQLKILG